MAAKQILVYGYQYGSVEIEEARYKKACEILSTRPFFEVLNMLETAKAESFKNFNTRLAQMENRHRAALGEYEAKLGGLNSDLQTANHELKAAAAAGRYSEAPALEAKQTEITQAIKSTNLEKTRLELSLISERRIFLDNVVNNGTGMFFEGLEWHEIKNVALAVILEWSGRMSNDLPPSVRPLALDAGEQQRILRYEADEAQKDLAAFKQAAQDRYSGSAIKANAAAAAAAAAAKAQTSAPAYMLQQPQQAPVATQPRQAPAPVSSPPAGPPGAIFANWGEVGSSTNSRAAAQAPARSERPTYIPLDGDL